MPKYSFINNVGYIMRAEQLVPDFIVNTNSVSRKYNKIQYKL